ncbi:hypothetical protein D3C87_1734830 [compost metagenome]
MRRVSAKGQGLIVETLRQVARLRSRASVTEHDRRGAQDLQVDALGVQRLDAPRRVPQDVLNRAKLGSALHDEALAAARIANPRQPLDLRPRAIGRVHRREKMAVHVDDSHVF